MNRQSAQLLTLEDGVRELNHLIHTHLIQCDQNKVAVLIAGGSGAGKTTLSHRLEASGPDRVHLTADNYYIGAPAMQAKGLKPYHFDDPRALDAELAAKHIIALINGHSVQQPIYSFERSDRLRVEGAEITQTIDSARVIIVDNLFAFYHGFDPWRTQEVPPHLRVARVYVDTAPHVRFTRRYERDTRERGKDPILTTLLWRHHVQPMYEQHVRHQANQADVVVLNDQWLPGGYRAPLDPSTIDCNGYTLDRLARDLAI